MSFHVIFCYYIKFYFYCNGLRKLAKPAKGWILFAKMWTWYAKGLICSAKYCNKSICFARKNANGSHLATTFATSCNWLRTITSDQTMCTIIRRFLFELVGISLDRNYREAINLLFVLPGLCLNILKTEKILQFWDKKFSTWVARYSQCKKLRS